ncbi:MAG: ABC transporter permease [Pseudomonadota bacterium]
MRRTEFRLAVRLAIRQWRAGDLWLIAAAGVLAVAITTLIAALGDRLERGLVHRAAEMLGADLVLAGSRPPAGTIDEVAGRHRLQQSRVVDFSTMLQRPGSNADSGDVLLVAVRAADDAYPLRGGLRIRGTPDTGDQVAGDGPRPGELWIEPRGAEELGIAVGDHVEIGAASLRVSALVVSEPDRAGDFAAMSPRVLMNRQDLEATGIVQPGSRVRYRTLLAGEDAAIAAARDELENLRAVDEELLDVRTGSRRTTSALARTLQFLSLAVVLGVVLCGATLALVADRQARHLFDTVALLRTFGLSRQSVRRVLLIEVLAVALFAGLAGTLLGHAAQSVLAGLLAGLLPERLPPPGAAAVFAGFACAFIALPAFLLPPLARLTHVSPLRVLRRDLDPPSTRTVWHYALGLGALALLLIATAGERLLAFALLGGVAALLVLGVPLAAFGLRALARRRSRLPLPLRLAADRLAHAPLRSGAQLVAFALIFTTLTLAALLRDDLFAGWQRQLPADAPNLFAMNLLPHERDAFLAALAARDIAPPVLYPVTPGRLVRIGDRPVAERIDAGSNAGRALDRDLVLTVGSDDPDSIVDGRPIAADTPPGFVSVEEALARRIGLQTGEQLTFVVAGEEVTVTVRGFRRVDWDSFRPNFYMVLSPGSLADAPYTWLSSFRAARPRELMRELRPQFPALTLIEVGPLLERLQEFVGQLAAGIEFLALLLFAAALLLLGASVVATLDERLAEAAVLRVFGARRPLLLRSLAAEFVLLGAGSGLVALAGTEIARWQLYTRVMDLPWAPLPALLLLPVAGGLLLAAVGLLAARRSLAANAAAVLRGD